MLFRSEVSVDRVKEIVELNKKGIKANKLIETRKEDTISNQPIGFTDGLEENSLSRFDNKSQNKKKKKKIRYKGNSKNE